MPSSGFISGVNNILRGEQVMNVCISFHRAGGTLESSGFHCSC